MKATCVTQLSTREVRPYIAKLVYTGKGILEESKFPLEGLSITEDTSFTQIFSTNEYEFNENDVIKVEGPWKINDNKVCNEVFIVENDSLTRLGFQQGKMRNEWSVCIEDYVRRRIAIELHLTASG